MGKPKQRIRFTDKRGAVREELLLDGESVSGMVIWKHDMRIGAVVVKMGGIAHLHTKPQHRMKGYGRQVMRAGIRYMQEHGFDISVLFGISDFYHRWHFSPCMASSKLVMSTRDAERAPKHHGVLPARQADMTTIRRMYHRNNYGHTGCLMRPRRGWQGFQVGSYWHVGAVPYVIVQKDKVVGYFVLDDRDDCCVVAEIGYDSFDVFPTMVKVFARVAISRRIERIEVCVPPDHPFVDHTVLYGADVTQTYPRNRDVMGAIINQRSLFEKMLPELSRRLAESALSDWTGKFAVLSDLEATVLSVRGGQVKLSGRSRKLDGRLKLTQEKLVQLVMGYRSVSSVVSETGVRLTGNIAAVLSVLFAKGFPYIWPTDHF